MKESDIQRITEQQIQKSRRSMIQYGSLAKKKKPCKSIVVDSFNKKDHECNEFMIDLMINIAQSKYEKV